MDGTLAPSGKQTDKRQAILHAALELFVERGFHGTAVPAVAQRAGVGAGTIYRYFANKEALVNELYRHFKQRLAEHLLDGFSPDAPASDEFHRIWHRMADFVLADPVAYQFLELHDHQSYLDQDSRDLEAQLFELALTFVRNAQDKGELRNEDPYLLWSLAEGAFIGLVRSARKGRVQLAPSAMEAARRACWDLIKGP